MGNPVITAIMMVLRLGIGVILFRLALNRRSRNLHWLAACFYLNFVVLLLQELSLATASQSVVIAIQVCLAMFTHTTFYQNQRSPVVWAIGGIVVGGVGSIVLQTWYPQVGGMQLLLLVGALNWFWHAFAAWRAWLKLRHDLTIEDWIKARYALVVAYALLMSVLFIYPLLPIGRSMAFYAWAWPLTMMVSAVLQYLAWGMPDVFRRYLNRNYKAPAGFGAVQNMTEEELLQAAEQQQAR